MQKQSLLEAICGGVADPNGSKKMFPVRALVRPGKEELRASTRPIAL